MIHRTLKRTALQLAALAGCGASFLHFLTSACAIVGGLFAVSGIVDATVYHGGRAIKKKIDLGKIS